MSTISRKKLLFILAIVGFCSSLCASAELTQRIDRIIQPYLKKNVHFSIHIVKADTGRTVYSRSAHKAMIPASDMKLITTAAALKLRTAGPLRSTRKDVEALLLA